MIDNPDPSDRQPPTCLLCGKPVATEDSLGVEMNQDADGQFHANQDHLNHATRVEGIAHRGCYSDWYSATYGSAFTISGDGT